MCKSTGETEDQLFMHCIAAHELWIIYFHRVMPRREWWINFPHQFRNRFFFQSHNLLPLVDVLSLSLSLIQACYKVHYYIN